MSQRLVYANKKGKLANNFKVRSKQRQSLTVIRSEVLEQIFERAGKRIAQI